MRQHTQSMFLLGALAGFAVLAGCNLSPAISDRLDENKGAEAFLDRVAKNCGKLSLGNQPVDYLLDDNSDDTYFIDESSKLYFGKVDRGTYTADINSFYPTDDNRQTLRCIFEQLAD